MNAAVPGLDAMDGSADTISDLKCEMAYNSIRATRFFVNKSNHWGGCLGGLVGAPLC